MADGSLIPVLDVAELLRSPAQQKIARAAQTAAGRQSNSTVAAAPQVLIVDDSLSVRQTLSELLKDAGYQPLIARDGVEAVELLRQQLPSIVLSDLEMPRMNGLELVQYIRTTHGAALPVVMITSRSMQKHRQQAEQAGADAYITKPFKDDALLEIIHGLLN
jgi:chemosensory pili system protein ChpA (sensor histidine kinase/response regulator)